MAARSASAVRISYLATLYGGFGCLVLGIVFRSRSGDEFPTYTLIYPGVVGFVAALACTGVLLYRSWRCIELHAGRFDSKRRTLDPGAAVALTFVPVVNLIGVFFSLGSLPRDLNWLATAAGIGARAPGGLGYAASAMILCTPIPLVGPPMGLIAGLFLVPPLLVSCSKVAESIENHLGPGPAAVSQA